MDKKEIQKTWDEMLLLGWEREWLMFQVQKAFIMLYDASKISEPAVDHRQIIVDLGLKRAPDLYEKAATTPVRGFIGKHSLKLSEVMFSGAKKEDVLPVIDKFKWFKKGREGGWRYSDCESKSWRDKKIHNMKLSGRDLLTISVRERDARTNWNVVK